MFRYLCEDGVQVFAEKQFLPAVRDLATKLILSGETESDLWPLESTSSYHSHHYVCLCVSGELHTYEALSSDTQKNVLSALRRLETVTKLRAWVTRSGPANLFGFKLIFCGAWEAVCVYDAKVSVCFLFTALSRMNTEWIKQLSDKSMTYFVSTSNTTYFIYFTAFKTFLSWLQCPHLCLRFVFCVYATDQQQPKGFLFLPLSHCSWENPSPDAPDDTWRKTLASIGTDPSPVSAPVYLYLTPLHFFFLIFFTYVPLCSRW